MPSRRRSSISTTPSRHDSALTYTITTAAAHGTLFRNGVALALNGSFTQADINNGLISYTHDGSETASDSFGFTVVGRRRRRGGRQPSRSPSRR